MGIDMVYSATASTAGPSALNSATMLEPRSTQQTNPFIQTNLFAEAAHTPPSREQYTALFSEALRNNGNSDIRFGTASQQLRGPEENSGHNEALGEAYDGDLQEFLAALNSRDTAQKSTNPFKADKDKAKPESDTPESGTQASTNPFAQDIEEAKAESGTHAATNPFAPDIEGAKPEHNLGQPINNGADNGNASEKSDLDGSRQELKSLLQSQREFENKAAIDRILNSMEEAEMNHELEMAIQKQKGDASRSSMMSQFAMDMIKQSEKMMERAAS